MKFWANLKSSLGDEKRFWPLAAAILGIVSFLKGFRRPCPWASTQALVNYDHGIIKRGFFGATFGKVFQLSHYLNFSIFSYLFLYILFRLLVKLIQTSGVASRIGNGEVVALFFSSAVISYLGVLVGYLDIPLAVLTLVLLGIANPTKRFIVAVPLCIVGVMIHEMFLVGFLPVILFSFVLDAFKADSVARRKRMFFQTAGLAVVCLGTTYFLAMKGLVSATMAKALETEASKRTDFWVDPNVYLALTRNAKDNFLDMAHSYMGVPEWRIQFLAALIIFLPLALVLGKTIIDMLRPKEAQTFPKWVVFAALAAMLAPLVLNALGSDCARWNMLACLDGFLILMLICRARPHQTLQVRPAMRNVVILLVAIHLATSEFPMGMAPNAPGANPYPFSAKASQFFYQVESRTWHPQR